MGRSAVSGVPTRGALRNAFVRGRAGGPVGARSGRRDGRSTRSCVSANVEYYRWEQSCFVLSSLALSAPSIVAFARTQSREMFLRMVLDGDPPRGMPGYRDN